MTQEKNTGISQSPKSLNPFTPPMRHCRKGRPLRLAPPRRYCPQFVTAGPGSFSCPTSSLKSNTETFKSHLDHSFSAVTLKFLFRSQVRSKNVSLSQQAFMSIIFTLLKFCRDTKEDEQSAYQAYMAEVLHYGNKNSISSLYSLRK